jgi:proline dehydrogenase
LLRRTLLAAAASERMRRAVTAAPRTRAIVDRYVAGEATADAVRVARRLRASGLLTTLDHLG